MSKKRGRDEDAVGFLILIGALFGLVLAIVVVAFPVYSTMKESCRWQVQAARAQDYLESERARFRRESCRPDGTGVHVGRMRVVYVSNDPACQ